MSIMGLLTVLTTIAALTGAGETEPAKPGCQVQLVPDKPSQEWIAAAQALAAEIQRSAPVDSDCAEIVVRVALGESTVAVKTWDGRHVVRPVRDAEDLAPTVQGVIVTIARGEPVAEATAEALPAAPVPGKAHFLLTAAGGGRLSFPGSLAGAVVDASAGLTYRRWEIALYGGYSPGVPASWGTTRYTQPSFEFGASTSRRQRWGKADLFAGVRAGTVRTSTPEAYLNDNANGTGTAGEPGDTSPRFLPCLGAHVGIALGTASYVRFRPQFLFEWLPATTRFFGGSASTVETVPAWSLTLSLGAESGVL